MKTKEFFGKFASLYLWGNLLAMAVVVALLGIGLKYGLDLYTHHGEGISVPNVKGMGFERAYATLEELGLRIEVSDSGYNKRLPADCILEQSPGKGVLVKSGHIVYVTVNQPSSPTIQLPDIIDNSSEREARAKLTSMGFKIAETKYVHGEQDWVYGVMSGKRNVYTGDRIPIDEKITLVVGDGSYDMESPDIDYIDGVFVDGPTDDGTGETEEEDEFEEVPEQKIDNPAEKVRNTEDYNKAPERKVDESGIKDVLGE